MPRKRNESYTWKVYKESNRKYVTLEVVFGRKSDGDRVRHSTRETTLKKARQRVPDMLEKILEERKTNSDWDLFVKERKEAISEMSVQYKRDWNLISSKFYDAVHPNGPEDITQKNIRKLIKYLKNMHIEQNRLIDDENDRRQDEAKRKKRKPPKLLKHKNQLSDRRINGYIAVLKAAANFGFEIEMKEEKANVSTISIPEDEIAHGRSLSKQEVFEYLSATEDVVPDYVEQWRFLIKGILYSGFRNSEAFDFSWDDRTKVSLDDIDGKYPKFSFPSNQKNGKRQLVPMIPEMIDLLRMVPLKFRTGRVFKIPGRSGKTLRSDHTVGQYLAEIGRSANIVVEVNENTGEPIYASAHDLRRTFANFVMDRYKNPLVAQKLMRHASFKTTQKYYAIKKIDELAEIVHQTSGKESFENGHTFGHTEDFVS